MTKDQTHYNIQALTREFEVTARTLRHYEAEGLLNPKREGQSRLYSPADRARLAWILRGRRVGFSLSDIGEMLELYNIGDGRRKQRDVTLEKCEQRIADLKAQRADIDATIRELSGFCDTLNELEVDEKTGRWISRETGEVPSLSPAVTINI